jgi:hypothetical protein
MPVRWVVILPAVVALGLAIWISAVTVGVPSERCAGPLDRYIAWRLFGRGGLCGAARAWGAFLPAARRRAAQLRGPADDLEAKVAERTRDLENRNFVLDAVIRGTSNGVFVKDLERRFSWSTK